MIKIKRLVEKFQYQIYCDMDSVLTDFDAAFLKVSDVKTKDGWEYKKKFGKQKFWNIINTAGIEFWSDMPWMPDGKKLWKYLNSITDKVYVLSAPSSHDGGQSERGKIIWCKKNLGPDAQIILEDDKWKFAAPNHILIDDLEKNIIPWRQHNGIGILYKSFDDTVKQLKYLNL